MNTVLLYGKLTRDPYYKRNDQGGTNVARYTLEVEREYSPEGKTNKDYVKVVAFGKHADLIAKCHEGDPVIVKGRVQSGSYANQKGEKVYTTDIVALCQVITGPVDEVSQEGPVTDQELPEHAGDEEDVSSYTEQDYFR